MNDRFFTFGTDGIRAEYGVHPMTIESISLLMGRAIQWIQKNHPKDKITLLVGRDTRCSSQEIYDTICTAVTQQGADVWNVGVVSTSAVAWLSKQHGSKVHMGIMITASHNPWRDNGIKFFNNQGTKFFPEQEEELVRFVNRQGSFSNWKENSVSSKEISTGEIIDFSNTLQDYDEHLIAVYNQYLQNTESKKIGVVVDTANGALCEIAQRVLNRLSNYEFCFIANCPDGKNINDQCGATHVQTLVDATISQQADIGVAFDGDGDRIILCDDTGKVIDGDGILFMLSPFFSDDQCGVVGTKMTNGFIEKYLAGLGIPFVRTAVGDKYVAESLQRKKWALGAESSGHVLLPKLTPSGDALLVFLIVLAVLRNARKSLQGVLGDYRPYPQKNVNLVVKDKSIVDRADIQQKIQHIKQQYPEVSLLVRPSGTENLLRIMVESEDANLNERLSEQVADFFN